MVLGSGTDADGVACYLSQLSQMLKSLTSACVAGRVWNASPFALGLS